MSKTILIEHKMIEIMEKRLAYLKKDRPTQMLDLAWRSSKIEEVKFLLRKVRKLLEGLE